MKKNDSDNNNDEYYQVKAYNGGNDSERLATTAMKKKTAMTRAVAKAMVITLATAYLVYFVHRSDESGTMTSVTVTSMPRKMTWSISDSGLINLNYVGSRNNTAGLF